ncbi:MAG: hypothetical protein K0V04_41580 [Deltaproteobacteria bacterium]|nr:hypothetical protein [Deltaproteobacteria bacterium]
MHGALRSIRSIACCWLALAGCLLDTDDSTDGPAMMDEATGAADGTGPATCFSDGQCDPLGPSCGDTDRCAPLGSQFICTPVPQGTMALGEGETCMEASSCDTGLVCIAGPSCAGGQSCCVALCDVAQPQCSGGTNCLPYFESGAPPPCYEDVGVCA